MSQVPAEYSVTPEAAPVITLEEVDAPRTPPPVQRFPIFFDNHIEVSEVLHALATVGIEVCAAPDGTWIANRPPIFHLVKADA